MLRYDRPSAPAAAASQPTLFHCRGIPLDTALTAPPTLACATPPRNYALALSIAGSFFRYYLFSLSQEPGSFSCGVAKTLRSIHTGLPPIQHQRTGDARRRDGPPKSTNLGISHFRFFLPQHRFFLTASVSSILPAPGVPKKRS